MGEAHERMTRKANVIDVYLARVSPQQRAALERLRMIIRKAAPGAEERISYGIPAFRLNGKFLVGFGAASNHCSFYPGAVVTTLGEELKNYSTSKGTIRFQAEKPLPSTLVRKLVKARLAKGGFAKKG
jgi:uncharacterized protein YdhG (YjbR/CyaY superfamily)